MEPNLTSPEDLVTAAQAEAAAAIAARDGALRELDSLRARIASADAIHKRSNQRESEHQKTIDALAAAELNLKAARIAEAQANARAASAESVLARGGYAAAGHDMELVPALQKQLGESRRLEAAATSEAADLRAKLAEAREQVSAVASDTALAAVREAAAKAHAELQAVAAQNGQLRRELDSAKSRIAQLESAAVTIHAQQSAPPPELAEARAAADKARAAARSAEDSVARLRRDLTDAQTRLKALESTLAATRAASAANTTAAADLAAVRKQADQLRSELRAVSEENRRIKNERSQRPPRPREERKPVAPAELQSTGAVSPAADSPAEVSPAASAAEEAPAVA